MNETDLTAAVAHVPFKAEKVKQPKCVWSNDVELNRFSTNKNDRISILKDLAYVVKPNQFFEEVATEPDIQAEMLAERYGGVGLGKNGGGARCGNFADFQVKGIGVTPVVGLHDNLYNSSGMYPLYEAVTEAANYQIYSKILPIGLVQYYGVLYIGDTPFFVTAEDPSDKQSGKTLLAVAVRQRCYRLGHLLPAAEYVVHPKFRNKIRPDISRVRNVNRTFRDLFEDDEHYIRFLGEFLSNCANQLAYCRIARIAHGALTQSNISIDGRWLDLTNTTFVPGGFDYRAGAAAGPTFLSEPKLPILMIREVVHTFGKFNKLDLDPSALVGYYTEQFQAYSNHYIVELIGLSVVDVANLELHAEKAVLLQSYDRASAHDIRAFKGVPKHSPVDNPIEEFIEDLMCAVFGRAGDSRFVNADLTEKVQKIYRRSYLAQAHQQGGYDSFLMAAAIRSLRRLYFVPFFYVGRIYEQSRQVVATNVDGIGRFVDRFGEFASWIFGFSDKPDEIVIFESVGVSLRYNPAKDVFSVSCEDWDECQQFPDAKQLEESIRNIGTDIFVVAGFEFRPLVLRLCRTLSLATSGSRIRDDD